MFGNNMGPMPSIINTKAKAISSVFSIKRSKMNQALYDIAN
ncbi:hypothetical protein GAGA_4973 [Paraglaciecola agarilytica NO2]|uniref:Uncharacterized protein n=1 Tax=Paraglaciecola agarilytica NO2 TaxID=1125747 RepID=A0ABQ0IF02_9ALTE|nr:hypothetical protein GAGA_4973 [Paraglaciecola agarilytica NO2]